MKKWKESEGLELKSSMANISKIIETAAGFASTNGGKIFIGVSNSERVLGVNIGKDTNFQSEEGFISPVWN